MLNRVTQQLIRENPEYASLSEVIEKEILHHDIMTVLIQHGALQTLTFIGGTALRMCYNSSRLSEDLDFNGGHGFKPSQLVGLDTEIQHYIQKKYETEVWVNAPNEEKQGDTVSWKISIVKQPNRPDLPRQKMHIDVCAVPSFDIKKRPLINHYKLVVPTEGLLVPVQSPEEILVDKLIALAFRARRIKPRDLWDITWLKQRGIELSNTLLNQKLEARNKPKPEFQHAIQSQIDKLLHEDEVKNDFNAEMRRFIPQSLQQKTLNQADYWHYLQTEVQAIASACTSNK